MPQTYEPIATITVGTATNPITFNSIPNTYTDLRLVVVGGNAGGTGLFSFRLNGLSTSIYSQTIIQSDGSSATSSRYTSNNYIYGSASGVSLSVAMTTLDLFSYTGSTNKTMLLSFSADANGSGHTSGTAAMAQITSAITSISIYGSSGGSNINVGTTATLYGIKKA